MNKHLFIYGTLLPERAPSAVSEAIKRLRYVGRASVRGRLYDLGEFPGAVLDASSPMKIMGRVFTLPEDVTLLDSLDEYEGFAPHNRKDSLFSREETVATLENGRKLQCWIYIYNQNVTGAKLILSGDYLEYPAA